MQEILQRIENLENQVANIKLALAEMVQRSSENENENLKGYKQLAQTVELMSVQLQSILTAGRIE